MNKVVTLYFIKPIKMKKTMSSYIVRSLEKGETIVLWGHYHWTFTASQVVWSYIFIFAAAGVLIASCFFPEYMKVLHGTACASAILSLLLALWGYLLRSRTEFAVTDTRFVQKDGILDIEIKEIPLYKVETVNFSQTFLQRLLGTGDIELVGSGGTTHKLAYIAHPMDVKKAISRAISNKARMQMARQAHSADEEE